jgi:hypothetical protein
MSDEGFAWRYELPEELQFRATNNLLEHIANVITPWVDMLAGRLINRGVHPKSEHFSMMTHG